MARHTNASIMRLGSISLVVLLIVMAAAFNLQKFPGFRGTTYHAEFTDAAGLHKGSVVEIAGQRVGRVDNLTIKGDKVIASFDVHNASFGPQTTATVEVLNLLGEKFLNLNPVGSGQLPSGGTIPASRTDASFDIVNTLGELTTTTEHIDTHRLSQALSTLGDTFNAAAPEVQTSFTGISRLSRTIASRDADIGELLKHADHVTKLLADRRGDLVTLMKQADLLFAEVKARRQAIHTLLVNTQQLAITLRGIAKDNQDQIGPALSELQNVSLFLKKRQGLLGQVVHDLAPYTNILGNIIGTGPWFDAYVVNLAAIATGEFKPGKR
jgi:phospholipid/cholesterol/gamma-HCH transport system substrate-binding protein